jgi:quercetin dioxygenase-like cupin family protein
VGVSASLISQVETGKTQPSVSTLYALSTYLGLSIDDLLRARAPAVNSSKVASADTEGLNGRISPVVQHAADNPSLEMDNGVRWERLAISESDVAEPLLVTYAPGASSSIEGKLMRHSGFEFAYILEGELTLHLEFETYALKAGDSLQFDSTRPHMYANSGTETARGVWFVVGRHQQNQTLPSASERSQSATENDGAALNSAVDVLNAMNRLIS